MKCSDVREAISARLDGEEATLTESEIQRHLAGCRECSAFAARVADLGDLVSAPGGPPPGLAARVVTSAQARRRRSRELVLRIGIVALALGELSTSALLMLLESGYDVDHAGHESLSFTVAICVALISAAIQPKRAGTFVPVIGVAVVLLTGTAIYDLSRGHVGALEELPHLDLIAAFVLLLLLSRGDSDGRVQRRPAAPRPQPGRPRPLRVVGRVSALALAAGLAFLVASPVYAHAVLDSSDPQPDTTLQTAPSAVHLTFDENVTTLPTSLRIYGPDGTRVDEGAVTHPGGNGKEISIGVGADDSGTYLVAWRVISADSHPVSGAYSFSVRQTSATPTAPTVRNDPFVAGLLGAGRWLGYLGSAGLVGGLLFLRRAWPAGFREAVSWRVLRVGAALLIAGSAVCLFLKGPYDAALGVAAIGRGDLIREVLHTTYGHATLVRLVLAVAALAALLPGRLDRLRGAVLGVASFGILATFGFSGHAAAGSHRALRLVADFVHVLSMSVWLGGLCLLIVVLLRRPGEALEAARRFSPVAAACVVALVATGVYQAAVQLGSWGALHTRYGAELRLKVILVVLALAAAAGSRRWLWRNAREVHAATADTVVAPTTTDVRPIRQTVLAEAVLGVAVLALTSGLVATQPGRTAYHPTVDANLTLGPDTVQVSAIPSGNRRMELHLYVFGEDSQPVDPAELSASVALTDEKIGPLTIPLEKYDVGHEGGIVSVPVQGDWSLTVRVRTSDIDEYADVVALPIR